MVGNIERERSTAGRGPRETEMNHSTSSPVGFLWGETSATALCGTTGKNANNSQEREKSS